MQKDCWQTERSLHVERSLKYYNLLTLMLFQTSMKLIQNYFLIMYCMLFPYNSKGTKLDFWNMNENF